MSINVSCVGIRSSLPKRRYRVVINYRPTRPIAWGYHLGAWDGVGAAIGKGAKPAYRAGNYRELEAPEALSRWASQPPRFRLLALTIRGAYPDLLQDCQCWQTSKLLLTRAWL
jgi:hypothetical protein